MKTTFVCSLLVILFPVLVAGSSTSQSHKQYRIGVLQPGEHVPQSGLLAAVQDAVRAIVPDSLSVQFPPIGYYCAQWNHDTCKAMARRLAGQTDIDLIVTLGPWAVEDLLAAGCKTPIVALYRNDPEREGLLDADGKPFVPNLTVDITPQRYVRDIMTLTHLVKVKRLGVLYFPTAQESPRVIAEIDSIGKTLGFETVTNVGHNNIGTFAFFKAYAALRATVKGPLDAVYLPPLWDMDGDKTREFLNRLSGDGVAVYSTEGRYAVERGAFVSNAPTSVEAQAWFDAWKIVQILEGAIPANLPTVHSSVNTMMINQAVAHRLHIEIPEDIVVQSEGVPPPYPSDAMNYRLDDAVLRAFSQNPGYLAKYDALAAAAAAAKRARSDYLPHLEVSASAYHFDNNAVHNDRQETKNDRYFAGLSLEQQLFSMSTVRRIQLAAANRDLSDIGKAQAEQDLELSVNLAFLNCLRAEELLVNAIRYRRSIVAALEMAHTKASIDTLDGTDVGRLAAEEATASRAVLDADRNCKVARIMFNALMNQPGETPFTLDTSQFSVDEAQRQYASIRWYVTTDTGRQKLQSYLLSEGLRENPGMVKARKEVELQQLRLKGNTARYFPTIGFRASFNLADRLKDYPPVFIEKNNSWSLGAEIRLPLILGLDRVNERKELKAGLSALEYERDDISLGVMSRVGQAALDLFTRHEQLGQAQKGAEAVASQIEAANDRYQRKRGSYLELIDAARSILENADAAVEARFSFFESSARIVHEVGWSPHADGLTPGQYVVTKIAKALGGGR